MPDSVKWILVKQYDINMRDENEQY